MSEKKTSRKTRSQKREAAEASVVPQDDPGPSATPSPDPAMHPPSEQALASSPPVSVATSVAPEAPAPVLSPTVCSGDQFDSIDSRSSPTGSVAPAPTVTAASEPSVNAEVPHAQPVSSPSQDRQDFARAESEMSHRLNSLEDRLDMILALALDPRQARSSGNRTDSDSSSEGLPPLVPLMGHPAPYHSPPVRSVP